MFVRKRGEKDQEQSVEFVGLALKGLGCRCKVKVKKSNKILMYVQIRALKINAKNKLKTLEFQQRLDLPVAKMCLAI